MHCHCWSNGAGKTTFAREYLTQHAEVVHFINADLIAGGLSPLRPELAAVSAGKLVLSEINRLMSTRASFAFESTLSGLDYVRRFKQLKQAGYDFELHICVFLLRAWLCKGLHHESSRAGIMCQLPTCGVVSSGVGETFKTSTNHWPIAGRCTTIRASRQN